MVNSYSIYNSLKYYGCFLGAVNYLKCNIPVGTCVSKNEITFSTGNTNSCGYHTKFKHFLEGKTILSEKT